MADKNLPVVAFRASGQEKFISLMCLMVDVKVEVMFWHRFYADEEARLICVIGEIMFVSDEGIGIFTGPHNVYPSHRELYQRLIPWGSIKMIEVV